MRYLKTNTATTITVGPFLDKTDGITPETAITVTGIHITFMVDNAGTPTLAVDADATTAGGGANDMAHVTNDDAGYYTLELAAANVNYLGGALLSLNVVATACPVFHEFVILPANAYDAMVSGTGVGVRADTQGWLGTAPATPTINGVPEVDLTHIAGSAVSTSTAQLGVNVVQAAGTAWASGAITAAAIANSAIDAATFAADVDAEVRSYVGLAAADLDTQLAALPTAAENADAVWDEDATGHQTGGTFGQAIGDPGADTTTIYQSVVTDAAGTNIAADIIAIEAQTDDIGAAGAGLSAIPWNASWDAEVQSEVDDALVAQRLDELVNADSDIDGAAPPTVGSVFHELMTKTTGSFTYDQTTDSLEANRDNVGTAGAGLTAADDAVITLIGVAGAGLTALATQVSVDDLPTNAELATALAAADDAVLAAIAALNNLSAAAVNAEVVDALATDTYAEPAQGTPAATAALSAKINYLYKAWRNRTTQTATEYALYADDAVTKDHEAIVSDDGVTFERGEVSTGA